MGRGVGDVEGKRARDGKRLRIRERARGWGEGQERGGMNLWFLRL
jgi:hypothetical protein